MSTIQPRGWQKKALGLFERNTKKSFLLVATPGAGKTIFSALAMRRLLNDAVVDFVVVVVPTTALKGDTTGGFSGDWAKCGIELTRVLKDGRGVPADYSGAVITYAQLPNIVSTFETWERNGRRIGFVFDEVHHASESNVWGSAAMRCGMVASKILSMSGTPFRGDGQQIAFITYEDKEVEVAGLKSIVKVAKADATYSYRQAVRDFVCRELFFALDDGMAEYQHQDELHRVEVSKSSEDDAGKVAATIFAKDSTWLTRVFEKADSKLDEYRAIDPSAGGIVICRPGSDENDDRHLLAIARMLERVTGEKPVVISYDDHGANEKIAKFRQSRDRWLVSVRKVSEGVDIKRLRVMVMASRPGAELLFRQMVGRVVRNQAPDKREDATVFLADFPQLREWASEIEAEKQAGITEREKRNQAERLEREKDDFMPLGSTHADGGGVSFTGEAFSAAEIQYAEQFKRGDIELAEISVAKIAHILRKSGIEPKPEDSVIPLHDRKLELRKSINKLARSYAIRLDHENPDYKSVWSALHAKFGVRGLDDLMDNYDISLMHQVEEFLKRVLSGVEGVRRVA